MNPSPEGELDGEDPRPGRPGTASLITVRDGGSPFARPARPVRARRVEVSPRVLVVVSAGSVVGALLRYLAFTVVPDRSGSFPAVTVGVNVVGCLAIGWLMALALEVWPSRRFLRPFLGVGVLGGFTTFSTFAVDTRGLLADGNVVLALVSVAVSLFAGLGAVLAGLASVRLVVRRAGERRARRQLVRRGVG